MSGTKVEFTVTASTRLVPNPPPDPQAAPGPFPDEPTVDYWNWFKVEEVSLTIGGESVTLPAPAANLITTPYEKLVRWASTHFADNAEPPIVFKAKIKLKRVASGDEHSQNPMVLEDGPLMDLTSPGAVVKPKVYNKGLVLATREEFTINPTTQPPTGQEEYFVPIPPYPDPNYPYPDGYSPNSYVGADKGILNLPLMNHTVINPSGQKILSETQLASLFDESTVFFGFTHGETTNFRSSEAEQLYFEFVPNVPSEVRNYVTTGRVVPRHNIVVMHACWTVGGSGNAQYHAPYAFQLMDTLGVPLPGRAYAGFTSVVWSVGWVNHPLSLHAQLIYEQLAAGKNIQESVDHANKYAKAQGGTKKALDMVVRGSQFARLINVYDEDNGGISTTWYKVFDV